MATTRLAGLLTSGFGSLTQRIAAEAVSGVVAEGGGVRYMAVPKKKTSYSRSRMRSSPKFLRPLNNIRDCPKCGEPKRPHMYCNRTDCHDPPKRTWPGARNPSSSSSHSQP
mmetsp:Transcript_21151/g.34982  ORF Transcript_21151/g.34982 Transcript_21151/m.34982 type:complete len:111 (+) Transcript_21151:24-356(+)